MDVNDLQDLYQQVILDHSRTPRNFRVIDDATSTVEGFNPLCGDQIRVFLSMTNDKVDDISFQGKGCAICTASSSMMTQQVKGKDREQVHQLFDRFHHAVASDNDTVDPETLGKLAVFIGVRKYPMRVKCASLPWHTLKAALEQSNQVVTTE